MNNEAVIVFLILCIVLLIGAVIGQKAVLQARINRVLSRMAGELKEILDEERDSALMVFTDNQELMALAGQINRLLEKQRRARADFLHSEISSKKMLSNISHDIKTPMTVVLGYLEIIRLQGDASGEMVKKAEQKAQDVIELINQFFTLAKLEAGDMEIELSILDICAICRETVLSFYEILTEKDFQVDIHIPEHGVYVWGDREALQRILNNLISNAVKYGAEGKFLGIALREEQEMVLVDVTDKGRGIDKKFAENVFERLFTMDDSRSRQVQGNGLGLTIARNLARQMQGDILLESIPYERTTFTLQLKKMTAYGKNVQDERNS
jgi:signal transduction histidine kinase